MVLILIAAVLIVVGVFLPWVSATVSGPMGQMNAGSKTGFELHQGVISVAVAVFSAILGATAGRGIPRKAVALLTILSSVAIMTLAFNLMSEPMSQQFGVFTGHAALGSGIFISVAGGVLLLVGGIAMLRAE
jgi:hypothetical protein